MKTKTILAVLVLSGILFSCGSKKRTAYKETQRKERRKPVVSTSKVEKTVTTETTTVPPASLSYQERVQWYITTFADVAKNEMENYGIPASITLAQGILESGAGNGDLTRRANNHFGIKCHDWTGESVRHDDDRLQECFRKYDHAWQSFRDHSEFLVNRKRYANLFTLKKSDYKGWAKGLKAAGYATDKKYPDKLISIIERYDLAKYDREVLGVEIVEKETKEVIAQYTANTETQQITSVQSNKDGEHLVNKGDTLYSISRRYKISVDQLKRFNGLKDNNIKIGQVLKITEAKTDVQEETEKEFEDF
ncbi:glucosaminidase domain-containing protein [Aquimarina brevivitae]|nr:glucosaminidase domain-containing protein [Aquimarina brevivitae]